MQPTLGRIVHYTLGKADVQAIEQARAAAGIRGNSVRAGEIVMASIVKVWGEGEQAACNLTLDLDGPDTLWVTSRVQGDGEFHWVFPPRIEG